MRLDLCLPPHALLAQGTGSARSAQGAGFLHLDQLPSLYLVDEAIDGDAVRHKGMLTDSTNVIDDALPCITDREPVDEITVVGPWPWADVRESIGTQNRSRTSAGEP